jgi:hypothetical protein
MVAVPCVSTAPVPPASRRAHAGDALASAGSVSAGRAAGAPPLSAALARGSWRAPAGLPGGDLAAPRAAAHAVAPVLPGPARLAGELAGTGASLWPAARRTGPGARAHRAKFVDAEDRRALRWVRVERDDLTLFGAKSGSRLVAHKRVRRQRTPSRRKIRRTWLRATWLPRA